ncbi:MAG: F0F1 ATP synthase subunit B [Planctomycetes bacterium]|nr:F0F1 ATP synthase subunit B [Planctomycetota bacterium]MBL7041106.1 F0F1 ATP synthase subunit B [Pirellulaceae bacterium]
MLARIFRVCLFGASAFSWCAVCGSVSLGADETAPGTPENVEGTVQEHDAGTTDSHAAEEGGHGAHDLTDLGHANATANLHRAEEWRYDMALCTFAVFVLLLTLLTVFAWKPIMAALEKREQGIVARIEDAERGAQEAAEKLKQYEAKLAEAADEAAAIVAKGRRDADAIADRIRDEAHQDAVKERERAIADIGAAKNAALSEITAQSADLAVLLAGRIVRREISADEHATLISDALKQFPSNN